MSRDPAHLGRVISMASHSFSGAGPLFAVEPVNIIMYSSNLETSPFATRKGCGLLFANALYAWNVMKPFYVLNGMCRWTFTSRDKHVLLQRICYAQISSLVLFISDQAGVKRALIDSDIKIIL